MKKTAMLLAVVFLLAVGIFAQSKPDYSGEWTLDKSKSKLDDRNSSIESMTVKATQTATDIKVESDTKRAAPAGGGGGGQGGGMPGAGGGGMGGGMRGAGGPMTTTYMLDGKETTVEVESPNGKMPVKLKGSLESDGKLKLSSSRTFSGPNGEMTTTTKETWWLSDGGKTLTIKRESESPRGTSTNEFVLTKK
jgi:hypothetical protein